MYFLAYFFLDALCLVLLQTCDVSFLLAVDAHFAFWQKGGGYVVL